MPTVEVSAEFPVSAERAWSVVADYDQDPRWRAGVTTMAPEPPGPVIVGTRTNEVLRFAGRTYRSGGIVTEVTAGGSFRWHTTDGLDAAGGRRVEPLGATGCRVTLDVTVRPHGAQLLLTPVLPRTLRHTFRADLARLRALLTRS